MDMHGPPLVYIYIYIYIYIFKCFNRGLRELRELSRSSAARVLLARETCENSRKPRKLEKTRVLRRPVCSRVPLEPCIGAAGRSRVPFERASEPLGRSKSLLERASEPQWRSKLPLQRASEPQIRSKLQLKRASEPYRRSKSPFQCASELQIAAQACFGAAEPLFFAALGYRTLDVALEDAVRRCGARSTSLFIT